MREAEIEVEDDDEGRREAGLDGAYMMDAVEAVT
jgi:hypothetical protein